jgi:hypothetical protein
MHFKIDISTVLDGLWREEQIPENVARKLRIPKNAHVDERRRVVLADDEFEALLASPHPGRRARNDGVHVAHRSAACALPTFTGVNAQQAMALAVTARRPRT